MNTIPSPSLVILALGFASCSGPVASVLSRSERLRLEFAQTCPGPSTPDSLIRAQRGTLACGAGLVLVSEPRSVYSTYIVEMCVDENGWAQGEFRVWSIDGALLVTGNRRDGLADGRIVGWGPSGFPAYCYLARGGKRDGFMLVWHEADQLASSTQFRDDQLHGEELRWAPNGQLLVEGEYFRGQAVGTWRYWNADGVFLGSYFLQNGTGKMRGWHDNGVLAWEGETEHGLEVGPWSFWNKQGELVGWCDYPGDGSANCEGETRGVSSPSLDETWREMQKRQ